MATPQEQYTDALRTGQEAVAGAVDSWTKAAQQAFGLAPTAPFLPVDTNQLIDQTFDFAEKVLESQRQFAKNLAQASASVTDALHHQVETVTDNAVKRTASATKAASNASKK